MAPSKCYLFKTMFANHPAPTHQPQVQVTVSQRDHETPYNQSMDWNEETRSAPRGVAASKQL